MCGLRELRRVGFRDSLGCPPVERAPTSLFDIRDRSAQDPARQAETHFAYLNRTGRSVFAAVRSLMDSWWRDLPRRERDRTRQAFRSRLDAHMMGAFWEIYLFHALRRTGYRVVCHPKRSGGTTVPDFKALGARNFYLEATRFGPAYGEVSAANRRGQVFDRLDDLGDANFMLHLDIERDGDTPVQLRRLERRTRAWLMSLDPDTVHATYAQAGWQSLPSLHVVEAGRRIVLQASPIRSDRRGLPGGSVGTYAEGDAVWVHAPEVIKRLQSTIGTKSLKYGRRRLPMVIAVLEDRDYPATSPTGMERALYLGGDLPDRGHLSPLFGTPCAPKLTRVSAVIVASRLVPWTLATYAPTVWHNPYATRAFESPFPWQQARYLPASRDVTFTKASKSPAEFLGLEEPWPPPDPADD
jgi:hypothetical protein